jgi:hypothetical protein
MHLNKIIREIKKRQKRKKEKKGKKENSNKERYVNEYNCRIEIKISRCDLHVEFDNNIQ